MEDLDSVKKIVEISKTQSNTLYDNMKGNTIAEKVPEEGLEDEETNGLAKHHNSRRAKTMLSASGNLPVHQALYQRGTRNQRQKATKSLKQEAEFTFFESKNKGIISCKEDI